MKNPNEITFVSTGSIRTASANDTIGASKLEMNKAFFDGISDKWMREELIKRFDEMVFIKLKDYYRVDQLYQIPVDVPLELVSVFGDANIRSIEDIMQRKLAGAHMSSVFKLNKPNGNVFKISPTKLMDTVDSGEPLLDIMDIVPATMYASFDPDVISTSYDGFSILNNSTVPFDIWMKSGGDVKPKMKFSGSHNNMQMGVVKTIWGNIDNMPTSDLNIVETITTTLGELAKYAEACYLEDKNAVDMARTYENESNLVVGEFEKQYGNFINIMAVEQVIKEKLLEHGMFMPGYRGPTVNKMDITGLVSQITDASNTNLQNMVEVMNLPCVCMIYTVIDQRTLSTYPPRIYSLTADTFKTTLNRNEEGVVMENEVSISKRVKAWHTKGCAAFKVYMHNVSNGGKPIEVKSAYSDTGLPRVEIITSSGVRKVGAPPTASKTELVLLSDKLSLAEHKISLSDDPASLVEHVQGEDALDRMRIDQEKEELEAKLKRLESIVANEAQVRALAEKRHKEELENVKKQHQLKLDTEKKQHQLRLDTYINSETNKELKTASKVMSGEVLRDTSEDYVGLEESGIKVPDETKKAREMLGRRYYPTVSYVSNELRKTDAPSLARHTFQNNNTDKLIPGFNYHNQLLKEQAEIDEAKDARKFQHALDMYGLKGNFTIALEAFKAKYSLKEKITLKRMDIKEAKEEAKSAAKALRRKEKALRKAKKKSSKKKAKALKKNIANKRKEVKRVEKVKAKELKKGRKLKKKLAALNRKYKKDEQLANDVKLLGKMGIGAISIMLSERDSLNGSISTLKNISSIR